MKRKVGTTLEESLYRRAKEAAREQSRSLNQVIAEALERFLGTQVVQGSVVAETKGTYKVSARALRTVLDEELYDSG